MNRYRVDFFSNKIKIGHDYVDAWSRKEAWIESTAKNVYKELILKYKEIMWDATEIVPNKQNYD